jgi:replicative DNA helicase
VNIETGLISKIVSKEDYLLVLNGRINKDFFEEHGEVFQTIVSHYKKYKSVPEHETLQKAFPNFQFYEGAEPLQFFIDKLKEQYKKKLFNTELPKVAELLSTDIDAAEKTLQKLLSTTRVAIKSGSTLDARNSADTMIAAYERREESLGVDGYSTSWPYLDALTCGYHGGELIIWMGKAKKGKSWMETWEFHHIWKNHEVPCLYITKEMDKLAIRQRFDAIDNYLSLDAIRRGQMTAEQKVKYYARLHEIDEKIESGRMPSFGIHGFDLTDGSSGVSAIIPHVEEYLGDGGALFVDGMYLIPDDKGEAEWRGIVNVAMDLKILAQTYNIPVIVTTQQSMEDKSDIPRLENAAYGKYIVQYADLILAIGRSDIDRQANRGTIYVLGQREGDVGEFPIHMRFDPIDFSQCYDKTVDDAFSEEDEDEEVYHV